MAQNETNMNTPKITFGVANTIEHHQRQLERKVQEIHAVLSGRSQPMLPKGWTDKDAWALAWDLANLMTLVKRVSKTVFDEENPYPDEDTPLEDIPYYNPYFQPEDGLPEDPLGLWAEVLHCGILAAAGNPDFCFSSKGTFADLEDLFLGTLRSGGGPVLQFSIILDQLQESLSADRFKKLQEMDFGPEPPSFKEAKDSDEKNHQEVIYAWWQEWKWLCHYPCRTELQKAIQEIQSEERYGQVMDFVQYEVGLSDLLRQAISLYLYQAGVSGMTEESYFVTYAMLCRTQKQMLAAIAAAEGLL